MESEAEARVGTGEGRDFLEGRPMNQGGGAADNSFLEGFNDAFVSGMVHAGIVRIDKKLDGKTFHEK